MMSENQFKIENYQANSFIIIEGKRNSNTFYIIRSGKVKISKENQVISEDTNSVLGPGDFFGVVSCMSGHARIETAIALENVSLIAVENNLFGLLIQKNPAVAMKVIRFFSRKLRYFDKAITDLTFKDSIEEDATHLFQIGEYYLKQKSYKHSAYAYQKYLKYCPKDKFVNHAIHRLKALKAPLKSPPIDYSNMTRSYTDNTFIFSAPQNKI